MNNFKGIEHVEIDLDGKQNCPVVTLIGLNESGKTTVLEGLSSFVSNDLSVDGLFERPDTRAMALSLIPMHQKAAFTGDIKVTATVELTNEDIAGLEALAKKNKLIIDKTVLKKPFTIARTLKYEDSQFKSMINWWMLSIRTKATNGKAFKAYKRPASTSEDPDFWLACVAYIQERLPQVSYFPTFLVDMPARIYLREHEGETRVNRHYRLVMQDILDSVGQKLSLEKHVIDRIDAFKEAENSPAWQSVLLGSLAKGPIDSVFQKLSSAITKEVLGSWQRVFQRSISATTISVDWNIDSKKDDLPYATFSVSDGESRYAINERSLGFRWFFSFLLFTSFKQTKERKAIFLFDEPAANLHAKAQAQLLTSFSRIASDGNRVVYSTHSHHMINPQWLGAAYIIENEALDYDKSDSFGLDTKPTKIKATPYRQFVSNSPTRSSYFQPVIEKLEYVSPEIVGDGPYLVVEGISDYYALRLAMKTSGKTFSFSIMPGVGSGASAPLISQMMARGQRFLLLLDDDREGKKAADKYKNDWYLTNKEILTLAEIKADFANQALEKVLGPELVTAAKAHLGLSKAPSKQQLGWYLAEGCTSADPATFLPAASAAPLHDILNFVEGLLRPDA